LESLDTFYIIKEMLVSFFCTGCGKDIFILTALAVYFLGHALCEL